MIDPRFANAGAVPVVPGYGAQQVPVHHHRHRHHRHRKNEHGHIGESPLSRDESIHKVDHAHHHFRQNDGAPLGSGYGVPYGAGGFGGGVAGGFGTNGAQGFVPNSAQGFGQNVAGGFGQNVAGGFGQNVAGGFGPNVAQGFGPNFAQGFGSNGAADFYQQQQFGGGNFGYGNQYQGNTYAQGQFGGEPVGYKHRHHHRHHRHHGAEATGATAVVDQAEGVPEQLIGQRSSSVLGDTAQQVRSPVPLAEDEAKGEQGTHHRRRHHRHHHHQSGEHAGTEQTHRSRQTQAHQSHTSAGANGYGHINDDLIFIERGEHSPHRQEPPSDYVYKGKIEVQTGERQVRSGSHNQGQFVPPQHIAPPPNVGHCPPGWQQVVLTAAPGGPCPPGGALYTGQVVGAAGVAHSGLGGIGGFSGAINGTGFGGVGPIGAAGFGGGLTNLAASFPIPPQCQFVADYLFGSNASGVNTSTGSAFGTGFQQGGGAGFTEQYRTNEAEELVSGKTTVIEVWQKRSKSETREKSSSPSRHAKSESSFDFGRLREEILAAIERKMQDVGPGTKVQWIGTDGGTQTQINPSIGGGQVGKETRQTAGEVRVIVQPIQPVFYMPRQTEDKTAPQIGPGPAPSIQQTSRGAPTVVYVPRNVYVPVIKPVFVPRERVIVRPQVIHVARPVLVDRPVPVTQRPIIIDRERPIPVPVRGGGGGGGQATTHAETSSATREEYAYQDNLPVGYEDRFAESGGDVNYDYTNTQQEQQYTTSSTHEVSSDYQTQEPVINVTAPEQYEHSQSASGLDVQQSAGSYHESYSNLAQTNSASAVNVLPLNCTKPIEILTSSSNPFWQHAEQSAAGRQHTAPIEVLDSTVNPTWQRTDQSTLVRLYGRPAYDIVQRTDQAEQQMYQELRQRSSSGGLQRPSSAVSYGSGSGSAVGGGPFSTIPLGDLQNLNPEGIPHQGPAPIPVRINY